jgi:hypothetical protein
MITQRDDNPAIILPVQDHRDSTKFECHHVKGFFFRCWPTSAREIFLIRMLIHREEKFAPANGGGVILPLEVYKRYFSIKN